MEMCQNGFVENSGSSGGGCGTASTSATNATWPTTAEASQPGFLSPSAVSAAAVAMGLSPTHLAYSLNHDPYHHVNITRNEMLNIS